MTTNAVCGENGAVYVGTHQVAEIGNWDMTISKNVVDVPKFGTSKDKLVCGPYEWSGSFSGAWYLGDTLGQLVLENAVKNGTTVTLKLQVTATRYYTGSAYVNQEAVTVAHDGIPSITFNFVGSGDLTLTYS